MYKRALGLLAAVSLLGAGCSFPSNNAPIPGYGDGTQVKPTQPTTSTVGQGTWKMMIFKKPAQGEKQQDLSALNFTLRLGKDGDLAAKICNNMSGSFSVSNGQLSAPQVISTLMFCEGLPGEVESAFAADLSDGMAVGADEESLVLTGLKSLNVYMFGPVK